MKINELAPVIASREVEVEASPETIWDIIVAVDSWPDWNSDVNRGRSGCRHEVQLEGWPIDHPLNSLADGKAPPSGLDWHDHWN